MKTGVLITGLPALLGHAYAMAACFHNGQFDKAGVPYFEHCLKVKDLLKSNDMELQMIALMHDLFEDTPIERVTLEGIGYSERVISAIEAMSHVDGETDEEYRAKVKANPDAVLVKMADLTHNSDIRRLKGMRQKDFDRTIKYQGFYQELKALVTLGDRMQR